MGGVVELPSSQSMICILQSIPQQDMNIQTSKGDMKPALIMQEFIKTQAMRTGCAEPWLVR